MLDVDWPGVVLVAFIVGTAWLISIYTIAKTTTGDNAKKKPKAGAKTAKAKSSKTKAGAKTQARHGK